MVPVTVSDDKDVCVANIPPCRTNKHSGCLADSNNVAQVGLASHRRLQAQHVTSSSTPAASISLVQVQVSLMVCSAY